MGKVMRIYLIALVETVNGLMYRLIDENNPKDVKNYPEVSIIHALSSGAAKIQNVKVENGKVVGTNGSLERYPRIGLNGKLKNKPSMIILNQIGNVGYTVCDYKGVIKKFPTQEVVEYAKKYDIANGKLVSRDNVEFISSITGGYEVVDVPRVKEVKEQEKVKLVRGRNDRLTENSEVEAELLLDQKDSLGVLTESQRNAVKNFYIWYTVGQYRDLAKSIKLNLAPGKLESLTELRGEEEWAFAGIEDLIITQGCGGHCTLGHQIRYAYYAAPLSSPKNTETWIVFGKDCAGDFFDISKEDMEKLVAAKNNMTDELTELVRMIENGKIEEGLARNTTLANMVKRAVKASVLREVFGDVGRFAVDYLRVGLPMPKSLVLEMAKSFRELGARWDLILDKKYEKVFEEVKNMPSGRYGYGFKGSLGVYYKFMTNYAIEGYYQHNATDNLKSIEDTISRRLKSRKDVAGYNKDTRLQRRYIDRRVETVLGEDSVEGFEDVLKLYDIYKTLWTAIENGIKELDYRGNTESIKLVIDRLTASEKDVSKRVILGNFLNATEVCNGGTASIKDYSSELASRYGGRNKKRAKDVVKDYTDNIGKVPEAYSEIMDKFKEIQVELDRKMAVELELAKDTPMYKLRQFMEKYDEEASLDKYRRVKDVLSTFNDTYYDRLSVELKRKIQWALGEFRQMEKAALKNNEEEVVEVTDLEKLNPLEKFEYYVNKYPEGTGSKYIGIPKAFIEKKLKYEDLTAKQRRSLEMELEKFEEKFGSGEGVRVWDNSIAEHPEIENMMEELSKALDEEKVEDSEAELAKLRGVMESIKTRKTVSERQYNYIKRTYDKIMG